MSKKPENPLTAHMITGKQLQKLIDKKIKEFKEHKIERLEQLRDDAGTIIEAEAIMEAIETLKQ